MSANNYPKMTIHAVSDRSGSRPYYDHDDRRVFINNQRGRGSRRFKSGSRFHGGYAGGRDGRARIDADGDVSMAPLEAGNEPRARFAPYMTGRKNSQMGGRRGNSHGDWGSGSRRHRNIDTDWIKIIIPYGRQLSKQYLLRTLTQATTVPFVPYNFQHDGNGAIFFLDDHIAANALLKLNHQLTTPNGNEISIILRAAQAPHIRLTEELTANIKECVARRYNAATHSLDLSYFHLDTELKKQGLYLQLNKSLVMSNVMLTVKENITDLITLDLTGNSLDSVDENLGNTIRQLNCLRTLLLAQNKFVRLSEFEKIRKVPVEELTLNGNPLSKAYRDQSDYVEAVRKSFPALKKLDGVDLPPQIGFDIEKAVSLPPSKGSFFINEDSRRIVIQFLEQYFALYDSANRQGLIDAYHDDALFSMAFHRTPRGQIQPTSREYLTKSRNLLRISDTDLRNKFLNQGKIAIIAYIQSLPKTQHDPSSFSVDVGLASASIISFSIAGIFKDVGGDAQIRAFSRSFVLVPQGSGFCIVNEMLVVFEATNEQTKSAFKMPAPTPSPSPVPTVSSTAINDESLHQQMTATFAQQSRMNLEWAFKCLQDNGWDYDKAAHIFTELNARGSIPPEAFQN